MLGLLARLCALVMAAASATVTLAQPFPARAVTIVVPFPAGGAMDALGRLSAERLSAMWGQPVLVENRAGAGGLLGAQRVKGAAPDGYTLLLTNSALIQNVVGEAATNPPYDPVKDLAPITLTSWGQLLLVAHPKTGWRTARELVEAARRQPGRLNYASPGVGTPHHLAMELFKNTTGTFITHIPYRGTGPAVTDLLGGQVETMFLPIHVALPHVKAGKVLALGIGSDKRHPLLPDLPTLAEAGVGQVNVDMWYGIFAPKGTPPALVAQLNREIQQILASEDAKRAFSTQGMDPATSTPEAFGQLVERDGARWAQLIKARQITAD